MSREQSEREARRTQDNRDELVERIAHAVRENGIIEPVKGLFLYRISRAREPIHGVTDPAFCVIAQGSKEVLLGDERFQYDPLHYLLSTVELPVVGQVLEASLGKPYLGLRLQLDSNLVASVMVEAGISAQRGGDPGSVKAINVSPLDANFLDATLRLVRLLDTPKEARILAPMVTREIIFRLLMGEQGARLRHIAILGGHTDRIARAIERLRNDYDKPLSIEGLARDLGMSLSGFHNHFKAVTAMSPLQFQKHLRLQEARRLMLGEDLDAASAGYRVGYDDASHFNREYKRLFGEPPMRDVERLRSGGSVAASL
ncbi:MAG: AraC family transcriptional regulator [Proteobacteria bacterium]|nr:MAG: AraC family transcriptional regulator [Pseudomonadota bacterium]